jgi:hypothetical protein
MYSSAQYDFPRQDKSISTRIREKPRSRQLQPRKVTCIFKSPDTGGGSAPENEIKSDIHPPPSVQPSPSADKQKDAHSVQPMQATRYVERHSPQ